MGNKNFAARLLVSDRIGVCCAIRVESRRMAFMIIVSKKKGCDVDSKTDAYHSGVICVIDS